MSLEELIIAIVRVVGSLAVLKWAFVGGWAAILIDLSDLFLKNLLDLGGVSNYQAFDKWLDQVYMVAFLVVALRWKGPARNRGGGAVPVPAGGVRGLRVHRGPGRATGRPQRLRGVVPVRGEPAALASGFNFSVILALIPLTALVFQEYAARRHVARQLHRSRGRSRTAGPFS